MRPLLVSALLALAASTAAGDDSTWLVTQGDVLITCPMTVGGSFEATTHALSGTLTTRPKAPMAGALEVDLRTLDTGIELRDEHLRDSYLEVGRGDGFDRAVLTEIRVDDVDPHTFEGKMAFKGMLRLHGTSREVIGSARVRRDGAAARIEATFPLRIPDFLIPKPRYLGVGVKDEIQVKVSFVAVPDRNGAGR